MVPTIWSKRGNEAHPLVDDGHTAAEVVLLMSWVEAGGCVTAVKAGLAARRAEAEGCAPAVLGTEGRVGTRARIAIKGLQGQVVTFGHCKLVCCCFLPSSEGIQMGLCLLGDFSLSSKEEVIDQDSLVCYVLFSPHWRTRWRHRRLRVANHQPCCFYGLQCFYTFF